MEQNNSKIIREVSIVDLRKLQEIKPEIDKNTLKKRVEMQYLSQAKFLILEVINEPVSFVLLKWFGKPTHPEYPDIEDLYTKVDERGKGYASLLIKECERLSKEKGFDKIGLAVTIDENDPAYKLYSNLGFKPTSEQKYVDGVYNGVED